MQYKYDVTTSKYSRGTNSKTFIMLHHTGGVTTLKNMTNYLAKNSAQVSAHYVIGSDGGISRIGLDDYILWHAGTGNKIEGYVNVMNQNAIGIEVVSDGVNFSEAQLESLSELVKDLQKKYSISDDHVIRHKDYSTRKWDIGDNFYKIAGYDSYSDWKIGELGEQVVDNSQELQGLKQEVAQLTREKKILKGRAKKTVKTMLKGIQEIDPNNDYHS